MIPRPKIMSDAFSRNMELQDYEKSIIGNALVKVRSKADIEKVSDELGGTALSEEGHRVFIELANKKVIALRL